MSFKGDDWLHVGGLIAIGLGTVDAFGHFSAFAHDADLMFIVAGLAGLGLKIVNGLAAAARAAIPPDIKPPTPGA